MPELPEVETVVRGLRARVKGQRIVRVVVHQPRIVQGNRTTFRRVVSGARIAQLARYGKYIIFHLESAANGATSWCLVVHLGMTGQLYWCRPEKPYEKHTQIIFCLDTSAQVRFRDQRRFGRLELIPASRLTHYFAHLGPEALEIAFNAFARLFTGRRATIKSLLLDQHLLRGLGNIYSDEALFRARIHPATPARTLDAEALRRLYSAIRRVLRAAIAAGGTSFSDYVTAAGAPGRFRLRLRIYAREGKLCRRCGHGVQRMRLAGRSSYFCPRCQRLPRGQTGSVRRRHVRPAICPTMACRPTPMTRRIG